MFIDQLNHYFKAEKAESIIFMLVGLATILFAAYCWFGLKGPIHKGMIIPFALIGAIQFIVGSTVYFRTDKQVQTLTARYNATQNEFQQEETTRMQAVMKSFTLIKYTEAVIISVGLCFILFCANKEWWMGLGIGMIVQGTFSIILDLFAEKRGAEYLENLSLIS